jgi:hypothetical protein
MPHKDPEQRRECDRRRAAARRAKRREAVAGAVLLPASPPSAPMPLRSASDVVSIIAEQVAAVRADPAAGIQTRARTVGFLLSVGLKALEIADLAARIAIIEERVGGPRLCIQAG